MSFGQIDSTRLLNDFSFVEHSLIFRTAVDLQSLLLTLVKKYTGRVHNMYICHVHNVSRVQRVHMSLSPLCDVSMSLCP